MQISPTCQSCFALAACGGNIGYDGVASLFPCTLIDTFSSYKNPEYNFIDPDQSFDFARRLAEVGFLGPLCQKPFVPPLTEALPRYITRVQGGVHFIDTISPNIAALGLIEIFRGNKKLGLKFGERELTPVSLRKEWGLLPDTTIILSGVGEDPVIEGLWSNYRAKEIAKQIASLKILAATAPNYTFWTNRPRLHNILNRWRMLRFCEALTNEGVTAIPHINSTHPQDWKWWTGFLMEHAELNAVAMEFGTGNNAARIRIRKIDALRQLRDDLGRDLHPIIISNAQAAQEIGMHFEHYTAIDATPSIKTAHRQRAIERFPKSPKWELNLLQKGVCMAGLFNANFEVYSRYIMHKLRKNSTVADNRVETLEANIPAAPPHRPSQHTSLAIQGELPLVEA